MDLIRKSVESLKRQESAKTVKRFNALTLQLKHCAKLFIGHNFAAMYPRTVGHPCRIPAFVREAHAARVLAIAPPRSRTFPEEPVSAKRPFDFAQNRLHQHARARALPRRDRAFTLIELLVVIAIIGILVGLLVPSLFAIYERARKTQAKNDLTQIANAVNAFYTDYGQYPLAINDNLISPNADLFYTLRAIDAGANVGNAKNPRQIVFISPRVLGTATARSGIGSDGQYYDPWGTPYRIEIDGNYNNQITTNPYGNNNGAGPSPLPQGVIGWSLGKDLTPGTSNNGIFTNSDDVISWQ